MKRERIFLLVALLAMVSAMSFSIIGCGGDDDEEPVTETPTTTTPDDGGFAEVVEPDWAAEKAAVLQLWQTFMTSYNDRDFKTLNKLWTNKSSDFLMVNISDNERIDAQGSSNVRSTLEKLAKGHHSTANDKWTGGNMTSVWVRKKGGSLQASAHGPNALRVGESWVYFEQVRGEWLINKVESIETRNIAKHLKIEIHEKEFANGIGFFDDDEYLR